jgi:class 3 adenylate cyclase
MAEGRKIAAILVADIVGYSRLTGVDEEGTLARLRSLREQLFNPTIDAHGGRVVKRTGDGVIIEFRSVVEAVRCALDVTNGLAQRNADAPSDRRIEVRTGIHLGDVVEEPDGDLLGDGVNIAARLEGISAPGGICLSEDAWRQVRDKLPDVFVDLGERQLKNISRPMRVYALGDADGAAPASAPPSSVFLAPPAPPMPPPVRQLLTAAAGVLDSVGRLVGAYADRAVTVRSAETRDLADPPDRRVARRLQRTRGRTLRRTILGAAIVAVLAARACHGPQVASPPPAERSHAGDVR